MSVEFEGIKGYEYQYLATQYISLLYIQKESVKIFVEDKEDARIIFDECGCKNEILVRKWYE